MKTDETIPDEYECCSHCGAYGLVAEFPTQKALACTAANVVELMASNDDDDELLCEQCEIELESALTRRLQARVEGSTL